MRIVAASNSECSVKEISELLNPFSLEHSLIALSKILSYTAANDIEKYLPIKALLPAVCNALGLFCKGDSKEFGAEEFNKLLGMCGSVDYGSNLQVEILKSLLRNSRHHEDPIPVIGRVNYLFDWIEKNGPNLSFENLTGISLEAVIYVIWGTYSQGGIRGYPVYDPKFFFSKTSYDLEKVLKVTSFIDNLSVTASDYSEFCGTYSSERGKEIEEMYTLFEDKPFLKLEDKYLLVVPHFVINELVSLVSKTYAASISTSKSNPATTILGQAFESYVLELIKECSSKRLQIHLEPLYLNKIDKGPDIVVIQKGRNPLIIEINKRVFHKTVIYDFSPERFLQYFTEAILNKFEQIIKWLHSHNMNYNGCNLEENFKNMQLVVCMAQSIPLLNIKTVDEMCLNEINKVWKKYFPNLKKLKTKNFYILGVQEFEHLADHCLRKRIDISSVLFQYKRYYSKTGDYFLVNNQLHLRQSFIGWLTGNSYRFSEFFPVRQSRNLLKRVQDTFKSQDQIQK